VGPRRGVIEQAIGEALRRLKRPHAAIAVDLAARATETAPFEATREAR